ncbi:hypothetical protein [Nostoc sp. WHI]|uniref:hypothetical protein n=1 Tax=Nostoc sp. WHI TaxID=2650611 RepID=UPI0018C52793|nr:hypothetical protein [Nostoc sp. WHI]MBG1266715.1 hypothetical protein [Nostoc sp. WHI]
MSDVFDGLCDRLYNTIIPPQNSELQAQNSERRDRNSELQARNSERRDRNSELQAQNSECRDWNS